MAKKKALIGFSRATLFPVLTNDIESYTVGTKMSLPEAQEMTREPDVSETKIYADDGLYANVKSWNGVNVTITLAEVTLELMEKLGFGKYDETTTTLSALPQGKNLEFAMTFRSALLDGGYRMYKYFSFVVNELKESGLKSKGDNLAVGTLQLMGTFTARKADDRVFEIHDTSDGSDMTWLDTVDAVPAP